jgi:hypothetical protein
MPVRTTIPKQLRPNLPYHFSLLAFQSDLLPLKHNCYCYNIFNLWISQALCGSKSLARSNDWLEQLQEWRRLITKTIHSTVDVLLL